MHLNASLGELGPQGQLLPGIDVGIVCLLKDLLQLLQLEGAECSAIAPLLVFARQVDGVGDGVCV